MEGKHINLLCCRLGSFKTGLKFLESGVSRPALSCSPQTPARLTGWFPRTCLLSHLDTGAGEPVPVRVLSSPSAPLTHYPSTGRDPLPPTRGPCTPKRAQQRLPAHSKGSWGGPWAQEGPAAGSSCRPGGPHRPPPTHPRGPSTLHEKEPSWGGGGGEPLGTGSAIDSRKGRLT